MEKKLSEKYLELISPTHGGKGSLIYVDQAKTYGDIREIERTYEIFADSNLTGRTAKKGLILIAQEHGITDYKL